jgi:hypothetical protein
MELPISRIAIVWDVLLTVYSTLRRASMLRNMPESQEGRYYFAGTSMLCFPSSFKNTYLKILYEKERNNNNFIHYK